MKQYIIFFLPFFCTAQPVVVGSDTAVSRQGNTSFPAADSDNEIRGFAAMENGFTLENNTASCLFNAFFPISGDIIFNCGTLNLNEDLVCEVGASITNVGSINGNSYTLKFTTTQGFTLPAGAASDVLALLDEVTEARVVNCADWSYDNNYIAVGIDAGTGNELFVYSFDGSTLTLENSINIATSVYSVRWHPSDHYIAVGLASGQDDVEVYHFNTSTKALAKTGGAALTGTGEAVAWNPAGTYLASSSTDNAEEVEIFSFSGGSITSVHTYNLAPDRDMGRSAMEWDSSGDYLATGFKDYAGEPELIVFYWNGSTLTQNATSDPGAAVSAVSYSPVNSYVAVGLSGGSERLRIYDHDSGGGTITNKTSAYVGESSSVLAVHWSPDGTQLVVGLAAGTGTEFRVYDFDSVAVTLTLAAELGSSANILSVRWSPSGSYIARGDANFNAGVYSLATSAESGNLFTINNLKMVFNSDVTLKKVMKAKGTCFIDGRGHILDLQETAGFVIDAGASLLFKDITIKSVSDDRIQCLDNLSTLSLRNVVLELDNDFTFTKGKIDIVGDVAITGTHKFTYQSNQTSTIYSYATWYFDAGMTFSYDTSSSSLLAMEDSTAKLHLYEATLYSTVPGLQLTKGTLVIEGTCPVESDATIQADGITLGDGVSASNNVKVKVLPESGLEQNSGFFVYKNV